MNVKAAAADEGRLHTKYDRLISAAVAIPPIATLVVHPCDESS